MKLPPLPQVPSLRTMFPPPAWVRGEISIDDAEFIHHFVRITRTAAVAEIGVTAGVTSAVVLHALDRLPDIPGHRTLHSCDGARTCGFAPGHAVGDAAREMYASPRAVWRLRAPSHVRRLAQQVAPASIDLTIVDDTPRHPLPLLDVLHISAAARPRSWVLLRDAVVPRVHPQVQAHGATWLFEEWPFETMQPTGPGSSIGGVRLPRRPAELVPLALSLLERPWEQPLPDWAVALPPPFAPVEAAIRARLSRRATGAAAASASAGAEPGSYTAHT